MASQNPLRQQCSAKTKSSGGTEQCNQWAVRGTTVCKVHGGMAPQVRNKGAERVARAQATKRAQAKATAVLAHEGVKAVEDPIEELGKLASSSQALMQALGERVNSLQQIDHLDQKDGLQVRVEVELYERAMDRTARLLDMLARHGYMERQVTIAETEALLVAGVVKRVIAALGLTKDQQAQAQKMLAEEFRRMKPVQLPNQGELTR